MAQCIYPFATAYYLSNIKFEVVSEDFIQGVEEPQQVPFGRRVHYIF